MHNRPTLADVAKAAGVSKTTASLSLNGREVRNVSVATRTRILSVARELGFQPHGVARALSRRRADVIGVVAAIDPFVHESHHLFEHGVLSSVFRRTLECGYNPLIYRFPSIEEDAHELTRYSDGRSDGFILLNPPGNCPLIPHLHASRSPTVTICHRDPREGGLWVDSDNESGISLLVRHLADLGHTRLAYLAGPGKEDNAVVRKAAFRATLRELNLCVHEEWIVRFRWIFDHTLSLIDALMTGPSRPTALLAWNDYAAEDICRALRLRGFRVPEDVSVVGFDDTLQAQSAVPPLTTVRQNLQLLGKSAVDLALGAIESVEDPPLRPIICPVELVVRESTAVVPAT